MGIIYPPSLSSLFFCPSVPLPLSCLCLCPVFRLTMCFNMYGRDDNKTLLDLTFVVVFVPNVARRAETSTKVHTDAVMWLHGGSVGCGKANRFLDGSKIEPNLN